MNITTWLLAATERISPSEIGINGAVTNGNTLLTNVLSAVYLWAGIICVVIIVIAGFFYTTSAGNASQVKRAKDALTGAIIGLVVVLVAFTITQFVIGRF